MFTLTTHKKYGKTIKSKVHDSNRYRWSSDTLHTRVLRPGGTVGPWAGSWARAVAGARPDRGAQSLAAGMSGMIGGADGARRSAFAHAFSIHTLFIEFGVNISARVPVYHPGRTKWVRGRLL